MADRLITSEIGVQTEVEEKKIQRRKPKWKPPFLDFRRLWKEFRKSNPTHKARVDIRGFTRVSVQGV